MKKLLIAGICTVAFGTATPAFAQVTGTVDVTGTVTDRCQFTSNGNALINLGEISGTDGKLDTAIVDAGQATLQGWCNGAAATIGVEAHPLLNPAAGATGFDTRVDYKAIATAGTAAPTDLTTDAGAGTPVLLGLFNGNIVVDIDNSSSPTSGLMVAGDYVGSIVVTLTPNVSFGAPA
ncbi:MAG: hypothetical protein E6G94_15650 [Alphaproteobacteria bacterium]|nr:MAG: hypothetical protein E6G94_15650 [Alphaproteobacteria bacterium]